MPLAANKQQFEAEMAAFLKEYEALMAGKKVAAGRARKALMNMSKLAKEMRGEITEKKNAM